MKQEITIDVGSVTDSNELHALLAKKPGFPDYYGMNWDAFDECIRDLGSAGVIRIIGFKSLERALQEEAQLLKLCLTEYKEEYPSDREVVIS